MFKAIFYLLSKIVYHSAAMKIYKK